MITNPIFKGFNPDPCICRKGDDYYCAVSSFEWLPGIPVYHSRDLVHWELLTHVITDQVDLKRLPSAKGIWAPCLTYCEAEDRFYVVYGVMNSMNSRYFDVDNYVISAADICGPWSEPVYLHSAGFDASMLHDDDGRKYVVSLEWETREGYEKPGVICVCEYDPVQKHIVGYPQRIWRGSTDRGCIEAPHLTKRNGYYYLMCAEGGTGYNHCATMARSRQVFGPYEADPQGYFLTSTLNNSNERADPDHWKFKYYNPESVLQKSGHASYVDLPNGETYVVHLTARPFVPDLRCTLGRETAIQKAQWSDDGWLRLTGDSPLAQLEVPEPNLPACPLPEMPAWDDFDDDKLHLCYYAPRILPESFASVTARPGYVRLRGQESRTSLHKVSILARKLTSVYTTVTTAVDFHPEVYQHSAGLIVYYDNQNYVNLRKTYSQTLGGSALSLVHLENGTKTEMLDTRTAVDDSKEIVMQVVFSGRKFHFAWAYKCTDGSGDACHGKLKTSELKQIGPDFDTSKFSDEYCKFGEFTGLFVGITCADRLLHERCADFDFFDYEADETKGVE